MSISINQVNLVHFVSAIFSKPLEAILQSIRSFQILLCNFGFTGVPLEAILQSLGYGVADELHFNDVHGFAGAHLTL